MDSINSNTTTTSTADTDRHHFFPTPPHHHFFDPLPATDPWPPQQQTILRPDPTGAETKPAAPGPTSRPSKKRSRASRRAPTTVLTTDTSNFRAMVQEFTGIPAPPFGSLPYFPPRSLFSPPPPPPSSFLIKPFLPPPASSDPTNFQSLLHPQLLPSPQPGELSLPGVIGRQQQQQMDPTAGSCKLMNFPGPGSMAAPSAAVFCAEKGSEGGRGDGLLESWMCSSD